jgi:hypothetical protein
MLPRAIVVGLVLLALALLVIFVPLLRDPAGARQRVLGLFRRPERKGLPAEADHYYRPYWS